MTRSLPASLLILLLIAQVVGGVIAFPRDAEAALSLTPRGQWGGDSGGTAWASSNTTTKVSTSFTPSNNSLVVVVFAAWNECRGPDPTNLAGVTISGGSLTWTAVDAFQSNAEGNCSVYTKIWTAPVTNGASMAITITHPLNTPDAPEGALMNVFDVTGYDTSDPIGTQISGTNVGADSVTLTLPEAPASDSIVLSYASAIISGFGAMVSTPGTGWTEQYDLSYATNDHLQTQTRTGSVSPSVTWNDIGTGPGGDPYGVTSTAGAFEIQAAPARTSLSKPPNNLGLVGYWPMNEATSTSAGDFSGNQFNGTLTGHATPPTAASGWTNGRRGGALQFDGTNDNVVVSDMNNTTDNITRMSISIWIKSDSLAVGQMLVSKTNATTGWVLFTGDVGFGGGGDDIAFSPRQDDIYLCHTDSNAHASGVWEHWVMTYDASLGPLASNQISFYKNGQQVATSCLDDANLSTATQANAASVTFGQSPTGLETYFDGTMDEVRIYNRALTAAQAAALYSNGTAGAVRGNASSKTLTNGTTLQNNLVGHWTFDGGDTRWTSDSAGVTYDSSGNNNIGTLAGMSRTLNPTIGKLGQAMRFDGTNDTISVPHHASLSTSGSFSLATWYKAAVFPGVGNFHTIITKNAASAANYFLEMDDDSPICGFSDVGYQTHTSSTNLASNTWYHLVCVFDTTANRIYIYVNGVEVLNEVENGTPETNTGNVDMGSVEALGQFVNGSMDDVRIYTRALTPAEAKQLYQLGVVKIVQ